MPIFTFHLDFSAIPNNLLFGVAPLLRFEIILIVVSLLICY